MIKIKTQSTSPYYHLTIINLAPIRAEEAETHHPMVLEATSKIIKLTSEYNVSLVLDADVLYLISLPFYRPIIQHALTNKKNAIVLTPNVAEYKRFA